MYNNSSVTSIMGILYVSDSQNSSLDVLLRQIMMIVLVSMQTWNSQESCRLGNLNGV